MTTPRAKLNIAGKGSDARIEELLAGLKNFERRFRLQEAVELVPWAVTGWLVAVLAVGVYKRVSNDLSWLELLLIATALFVAALLGVFGYALLRPRDQLATALHADVALGLDERLSTALEAAAKPPVNPSAGLLALRNAQLDDALLSIKSADRTRDLPLAIDRKKFLPSGGLIVLLLAVQLMPSFSSTPGPDKIAEQVKTEQQNIEILKEAIQNSPNANDPALQKLLEELAALSHDLNEGDLSREEALARLSQTEAALQKALDPQSPGQREALEALAEQMAGSSDPNMKQAGDALQNNDPQKAAEALKNLAQNADKMTPEERKALADALREMRDQVASLDPEMASRLEEAAASLDSGDPEAAQQALNNLADKVDQTSRNVATQKQIEQSLAQIQASKENISGANQGTPTSRGTAIAGTPGISGTPGTPGAGGTAIAIGSPVSGTPGAQVTGTVTIVAVVGTVQPGATGTPVLVPGQGQGQGQGQSQGQGQGQNQGQGPSQGAGQGQGQGQGQNNGNAGPPSGGWGTGHEEPVYVPPSSVQATVAPVQVQGQDNPGGEQSTAPTNTDANSKGPSTVPYEQVYGEYEQQAGTALDGDYIPQGYKDLVRDYFSEIAPR